MRRLNHPVYRNRVLQIAADAVLVALAYFLAFQLRFLDDPHGWPHRYEILFAQSVGFVVAGKLIVFAAFGLYQKWWRYVSGRDFMLILRAVVVSSAILVVFFAVAKPFAHTLPRSVEVTDFVLTLIVIAIPSAPGTLRGKVVAACREREIPVRTLPTVFELLRGGVQLNKQLREVQVED